MTLHKIRAILLDADGVLQKHSSTLRDSLVVLCGDLGASEEFLADVVAAEKTCLTGIENFKQALTQVLLRWKSTASVEEIMLFWTQIEPNQEMHRLVAGLRRSGLVVALASNQSSYRAAFMSDHLGYASKFDHLLYSCDLGYAKPNPEYYIEAASRVSFPMDQMLFIDDHEPNVLAARGVGLFGEVFHLSEGVSAAKTILQRYGIVTGSEINSPGA